MDFALDTILCCMKFGFNHFLIDAIDYEQELQLLRNISFVV